MLGFWRLSVACPVNTTLQGTWQASMAGLLTDPQCIFLSSFLLPVHSLPPFEDLLTRIQRNEKFLCWCWKCKMIWTPQRAIWRISSKAELYWLSYDLPISLPGTDPRETPTVQEGALTEAPYVSKYSKLNQSKYPLTGSEEIESVF